MVWVQSGTLSTFSVWRCWLVTWQELQPLKFYCHNNFQTFTLGNRPNLTMRNSGKMVWLNKYRVCGIVAIWHQLLSLPYVKQHFQTRLIGTTSKQSNNIRIHLNCQNTCRKSLTHSEICLNLEWIFTANWSKYFPIDAIKSKLTNKQTYWPSITCHLRNPTTKLNHSKVHTNKIWHACVCLKNLIKKPVTKSNLHVCKEMFKICR